MPILVIPILIALACHHAETQVRGSRRCRCRAELSTAALVLSAVHALSLRDVVIGAAGLQSLECELVNPILGFRHGGPLSLGPARCIGIQTVANSHTARHGRARTFNLRHWRHLHFGLGFCFAFGGLEFLEGHACIVARRVTCETGPYDRRLIRHLPHPGARGLMRFTGRRSQQWRGKGGRSGAKEGAAIEMERRVHEGMGTANHERPNAWHSFHETGRFLPPENTSQCGSLCQSCTSG